jgi:hypothetical protein
MSPFWSVEQKHNIMKKAVKWLQHDEVYTLWNDTDKLELRLRRNEDQIKFAERVPPFLVPESFFLIYFGQKCKACFIRV